MHLQVLIYPERIQRSGIKSGQEHIYYDKQIQLLVLHTERYILVVVLEFLRGSIVIRMEGHVVIHDGFIKEVSGAFIQSRSILRILFIDNTIRFFFVWCEAVDNSNTQFLGRVCLHLLLELCIIEFCHRNRCNRKDRVKSADTLFLLDFLHLAMCSRGNILNVCQLIENIGFVSSIGLLIEMIQNILGDQRDSLWSHKCFFSVDIPYLLIVNIPVDIHGLDVIHSEWKYVLIIDSINDGVGMKLVTKGLCCGEELRIFNLSSIHSQNRCSGEAEHIIFLEVLHDSSMHITELTAMAFIEDDNNLLLVNLMVFVLLDEGRQLLNSCNDDMGIRVFQLLLQNSCTAVRVGSSFLETVILLHGLVVQILTVNDKEHLIDIRQLRCKSG